MPDKPVHTERPLYAWEIQEARRVFGSRLRYEEVRVHENAGWPDIPYRTNLMMRRLPLKKDVHNAITLGNHLYFPVQILEELVLPGHPEFYKLPWLIHELAHAWQYQRIGWGYLTSALNVQLRLGTKAYDFGGAEGLLASFSQGMRLEDFNLEQQADILSTYYTRLAQNGDTTAWQPFVREDSGSMA